MGVPVKSWNSFRDGFTWNAGEHVTILGKTGSGKSVLATHLLTLRRFVVVLGTKPRDPTLKHFKRIGYRRHVKWPAPPAHERVLLWPKMEAMGDIVEQRAIISGALDDIYTTGAWCIYVDELPYVANTIGQAARLELLWLQGRALGVSLVASAQRPAWVPMAALTQPTHLFLYRQTDARDLKRLGEISGDHDTDELRRIVRQLPRHAFLHVNVRDGDACVSRSPDIR